jgi:hypothetical protein
MLKKAFFSFMFVTVMLSCTFAFEKVASPSAKYIAFPEQPFQKFVIYDEFMSKDNHFIPSGYMGNFRDITIRPNWGVNPHTGKTCYKVMISSKNSQGAGWAGVYWQNSANNWATVSNRGFDLTGATKLTFWARGEKGGERISEFKIGGISGEFPDSDSAAIYDVDLNTQWTRYSISLDKVDLKYIIGGFCFAVPLDMNAEGVVFYLDDMIIE